MTTLFLTPKVTVTVNGFARRTLGGTTSCGLRSSFATASINFDSSEPATVPGDRIVIELGYVERGTQIVFTGEVEDDNLDYYPQGRGVTCTGYLARLQRALGVEDATAAPYEDSDIQERPALAIANATDMEVAQIILLTYGVPQGDIEGDSPATTFGVIEPIRLRKTEPAWSILSDLDRLTYMRTFDGPDGVTRRLPINGVPSSPALTLREGVDLLPGSSRSRSRRGIVNHVITKGLADAGGPGVTPKAERKADSKYIPNPPRYQNEEWQTPLAETEAVCDRYSARRLGALNRLTESVQVALDHGRPDIYPAMSVAIAAPHFEYDSTYVFWVEQVEHSWDSKAIHTKLGLFAATGEAGLNPNQAPVALLDVKIETEYLADGTQIWVVFANGAASYDPDGVAIDIDPRHGITTYLWSGTPQGPATPAGLAQATYVYTTNPTGATITLTVTDSSLKIGTATATITAAQVRKAGRRDLWGAATTELYLTVNAGKSWKPVGVPAVGVCEIAHPEYQLAWGAGGAAYRITVDGAGDFLAAPIVGLAGVTAMFINVGIDGRGTGRALAGTSTGQVFVSIDDGETWGQVGTIIPAPIRAIEEAPDSPGSMRAVCGSGEFYSFDNGVKWTLGRGYPDTALEGKRLASGRFADLSQDKNFHWVIYAGSSVNTESRLLEEQDFEDVDWPNPAKPVQPTGLTIGLYQPELYLTDFSAGGPGRTWHIADFTGGGNLVQKTYNSAFGVPQHIIRDGLFDGIVYGAGSNAFFKTYDKFASVVALKWLADHEPGMMIGYGILRGPLPATGDLVWSAFDGFYKSVPFGGGTVLSPRNPCIMALTEGGFARRADPHPCDGMGSYHPLVATAPGVLLTWAQINVGAAQDKPTPGGQFNSFYSLDGGVTWQATGLEYVAWVGVGAGDGNVVAVCWEDLTQSNNPADDNAELSSAYIYTSADGGITWAQRAHWIPFEFTHSGRAPAQAEINPVDPTHIMVRNGQSWLSTDGGATFGPDPVIATRSQAGLGAGAFGHYTVDGAKFYWYDAEPVDQPLYVAPEAGPYDPNPVVAGDGTPGTSGGSLFVHGQDNHLYSYGFGGAYRLDDHGGGLSAQIFSAASIPAAYTDPRDPALTAFVPGDAANDSYACAARVRDYFAIARLKKGLDPALTTEPWDDLTPQLLAAFPDGKVWCQLRGATRLIAEGEAEE